MKSLAIFFILGISFWGLSCTKTTDSPATEVETTTRTLVTNPWKIDRVTDASGNVINTSNLPAESRALFGINIQFNEDKTVRAIDPTSKSIVNGGSWDFADNQQALNIDVSQLKGLFPIVKLERSRMVLRNKVQFNGLAFDVNLELVPAL